MSDRTLFDFPLWFAENQAILWSRLLLGDEKTEEIAQENLSSMEQLKMAQRHPNQSHSMLESRAERLREKRNR